MITTEQGEAIIKLLSEIKDLLKAGGAARPAATSSAAPTRSNGTGNAYSKLKNGDWGVRTFAELKPGATIQVETKAGKIRTETIRELVWQGEDRETKKHVWLYAVIGRDEKPGAPAAKKEAAPTSTAAAPTPEEDDVPF